MTELTLSGAWMALTDPNGFTPRRGQGAHARASEDRASDGAGLEGAASLDGAGSLDSPLESRPSGRPAGPRPADPHHEQNDIADGPAASKGGAVRIASVIQDDPSPARSASRNSGAPRESDRKVEWVRGAVATFERPLTQYSLHLLGGDLERARDLVQEAFLRLCAQEEQAVEGHIAEWLYTVCRNLAIDVKRKERRMRLMTEEQQDAFAATQESPIDAAERVDASSRVNEALQTLPPRQQEIVRLKFQHGMSYKEIGEIMNLTPTNIGFILHTAIKSLRQDMGSDPQSAGNDS